MGPKKPGFYEEDLILKAKTNPNNDQKPKAERGIFPHSQTMLDFKLISSHPWWVKICEIYCFTKLPKAMNFREFIVEIWVFVMTSDRRVMLPYIKGPSSKSARFFHTKTLPNSATNLSSRSGWGGPLPGIRVATAGSRKHFPPNQEKNVNFLGLPSEDVYKQHINKPWKWQTTCFNLPGEWTPSLNFSPMLQLFNQKKRGINYSRFYPNQMNLGHFWSQPHQLHRTISLPSALWTPQISSSRFGLSGRL